MGQQLNQPLIDRDINTEEIISYPNFYSSYFVCLFVCVVFFYLKSFTQWQNFGCIPSIRGVGIVKQPRNIPRLKFKMLWHKAILGKCYNRELNRFISERDLALSFQNIFLQILVTSSPPFPLPSGKTMKPGSGAFFNQVR